MFIHESIGCTGLLIIFFEVDDTLNVKSRELVKSHVRSQNKIDGHVMEKSIAG